MSALILSGSTVYWIYGTKRKNPITKELEGQCQRCNKVIKCLGNSTNTLKKSLKKSRTLFR